MLMHEIEKANYLKIYSAMKKQLNGTNKKK